MSKNFNDAVLNDLDKRFGKDVAERFKDKGFLKSMESFFGTVDGFKKSVHQVELDQSGLDSPQSGAIDRIFNGISNAMTTGEPLLFIVSSYDEYRSIKVMLDRFIDIIPANNITVKRLPKTSKDAFITAISDFTTENGITNNDHFNVIASGCGSYRDMVVPSTLSYMKSDGAEMSFVGDIKNPTKNDISTKIGDETLSAGQLISMALNEVVVRCE